MRPKSIAVASVLGLADVAVGIYDEAVVVPAIMMSLDVTAWMMDVCRFSRNSALAVGVGEANEEAKVACKERRCDRPLKLTSAF